MTLALTDERLRAIVELENRHAAGVILPPRSLHEISALARAVLEARALLDKRQVHTLIVEELRAIIGGKP